MTRSTTSRWEGIRARKLADPVVRERYERTRRSVRLTRQVLQAIEAERERTGLSKAKLAHRVGVNPSAIRRMLTSQSSNPTLKTVAEVLDALGLELALRRKARPAGSACGKQPKSSADVPAEAAS